MPADSLHTLLASLPESPGIYKFYDKEDTLIYIGKAKNLKKRVSSYFSKQHAANRKTAVMVSKIVDLQFTLVETEIDALLLENSLIKQFQPRFNINLKDDKTYPFICVKHEPFPRIFPTRRPVKDGSEYYGPYASVSMMHVVLDLIRQLYPIRTCQLNLSAKSIEKKGYKTCLEFDIGNCKGPCVGLQTEEAYLQNLTLVKGILKGNLGEARHHLQDRMKQFATEMRFEQAALEKKKLEILENYQSRSTIVTGILHDVDVFSIVSDDKFAFANYLKVAHGIVIQTQTFEIRKKMEETDAELLSFAIAEVRTAFHSRAKEVIVPFELEIEDEHISFTVPKAGEKKKLLDLSVKNALYYKKDRINQHEKLNPELRTERILNQMMKDLRLTEPPAHIECFDNSNLQGSYPVSACVVFKNAKPSKKDYRIFNVKTVEGPNDFATMEEVILRRYKRMLEEGSSLPNLIIIDGGKGQLSSAVSSLQFLGIYGKVPVIGIAKRLEELYYPDDELPLYLDKKSETLKIIQQLRDEAHRFGITHHRARRSKAFTETTLEQVKGIGPETAKALLRRFKSVKKIAELSLAELTDVVGSAKAQLIYQSFHETLTGEDIDGEA